MTQSIRKVSIGSTIGLITPSSPLASGLLEASIAYFEQEGFEVKIGKHNTKAERFLAGTDQERAEDIMTFFKDPDVSALIATNGGACSIRTLPLLDFEIIKNNPKPIIGFSDTTALQLGINKKTELVSYTGFTCSDVNKGRPLDALIKETLSNCLKRENYTLEQGKTVNPGIVTAPLMGGNLTCFLNLMGTPFQPDFKNKILFFEDVWVEPYVIEGMMAQLYLSGILEQAAGVIIGTFNHCEAKIKPDRDGTVDDVMNDWCRKIKVPCIKDFPYGHVDSRCVLPLGQLATLDATQCTLDIHFDQ